MPGKMSIEGKLDRKPKRSVKRGIKSAMKIKEVKSMNSFKTGQNIDLFV